MDASLLARDVSELCHHFELEPLRSEAWLLHAARLPDALLRDCFPLRDGAVEARVLAPGGLPPPASHPQSLHAAWHTLDGFRVAEYGMRALAALLSEASVPLLHALVEGGLVRRLLACLVALQDFERRVERGDAGVLEGGADPRTLRCVAAVRRLMLLELLLLLFAHFEKPGVEGDGGGSGGSPSGGQGAEEEEEEEGGDAPLPPYARDYLAALRAWDAGAWEQAPGTADLGWDLQCPMAGALVRGRTEALGELALVQGLRLDLAARMLQGEELLHTSLAQPSLLAPHPLADLLRRGHLQRTLLLSPALGGAGSPNYSATRPPLLRVAAAALLSCSEEWCIQCGIQYDSVDAEAELAAGLRECAAPLYIEPLEPGQAAPALEAGELAHRVERARASGERGVLVDARTRDGTWQEGWVVAVHRDGGGGSGYPTASVRFDLPWLRSQDETLALGDLAPLHSYSGLRAYARGYGVTRELLLCGEAAAARAAGPPGEALDEGEDGMSTVGGGGRPGCRMWSRLWMHCWGISPCCLPPPPPPPTDLACRAWRGMQRMRSLGT